MIKVCFLSISFPLTNEVIRSLRAELIRLAEADTHLEFWFSGCHDRFVEKAVKFILEIRDVLSRSLHSAAHSGRWCGGPAAAVRFKQRPKLVSYIRFNHHGVVLCCTL